MSLSRRKMLSLVGGGVVLWGSIRDVGDFVVIGQDGGSSGNGRFGRVFGKAALFGLVDGPVSVVGTEVPFLALDLLDQCFPWFWCNEAPAFVWAKMAGAVGFVLLVGVLRGSGLAWLSG